MRFALPKSTAAFLRLSAACLMAGCSLEGSSPTGLEAPASFASVHAAPLSLVTADFEAWDPSQWLKGDHPLGRGYFEPANVSVADGQLLLKLPAGTTDGGEILSAARVQYGSYEARLRAAHAPGSLTAFFLYEGVPGDRNGEIDIEIFGDGSGIVWFTTWVRGRQTNHQRVTLPFDPTADFHDYKIQYERNDVRFFVDGQLKARFTKKLPDSAMHVMVNAWWPTWIGGGPYATDRFTAVDWIRY